MTEHAPTGFTIQSPREITMDTPELAPEPGWTPFDPFMRMSSICPFISRDGSDKKLRIRYFRHDRDGMLRAKVWFGPASEGPPGHAHGGALAAVLDEALGAAAWAQGLVVMTGKLTVKFRRSVPLGTVTTVEMSILRTDRHRVQIAGGILDEGGKAYAQADGIYLRVPQSSLTAMGKVYGVTSSIFQFFGKTCGKKQ